MKKGFSAIRNFEFFTRIRADKHQIDHSEPSCSSVLEQVLGLAALLWDSTAIVSRSGRTSYGEIVSAATSLGALCSARLSGASNRPIAIFTDDPKLMIIGALGAWKARCAYLPINPSTPLGRLRNMLLEAAVPIVAATKKDASRLPRGSWKHVALDETVPPSPNSAPIACDLSAECIHPDDLAYIMFTSGSTGRPKGVAVTHANLSNLVAWYRTTFHIDQQDRVTQLATLTFDTSIAEIWPTLAVGAKLFVPGRPTYLSPERLRDYLVLQGITICDVSTAVAEELLTLRWPQTTRLRYLITGGDTLHRFPLPGLPFKLVNEYGPTECTVVATAGVIQPQNAQDNLPSIGFPIRGTEILLLDTNRQPVRDKEHGEIWIAGAGVSAGYINRPDLTAERFFRNSLREDGSRMYRTGDLARKLPNGEFEFCGRLDDQIKLRGYRIEPGEIVSNLRDHPAIKSAAVVALGDDANRCLVAYVVLESEITARALRDHLKARLPAYMIPACFVRLEKLPLTQRGKLDRAALPIPSRCVHVDKAGSDEQDVSTPDEIERELIGIWRDLLDISEISLDDDFFELGGNSLLAARLFYQIERRFNKKFRLSIILELATVRQLAALIRGENRAADLNPCLTRLSIRGSASPLFLVHPIGGNVLVYRELALLLPEQPVYGIQFHTADVQHSPLPSMQDLASRYLDAVRTIQPHGPYYIGGYSTGGVIAFEMQLQLEKTGETVAYLGLIDSHIGHCLDRSQTRKTMQAIYTALAHSVRSNLQLMFRIGFRRFLRTRCNRHLGAELRVDLITKMRLAVFTMKSSLRRCIPWKPVIGAREIVEFALANYTPPASSGGAVLYRCSGSSPQGDPAPAWRDLFTGKLEIQDVPGEHDNMLFEPQVVTLASKINAELNHARQSVRDWQGA